MNGAPSHTLDARDITSGLGIAHVQVFRRGIFEQPRDGRINVVFVNALLFDQSATLPECFEHQRQLA